MLKPPPQPNAMTAPADGDLAGKPGDIEPDHPAPLAGAAPGFALPPAAAELASADDHAALPIPASPLRDEVKRLVAAAFGRFSAKDYPPRSICSRRSSISIRIHS